MLIFVLLMLVLLPSLLQHIAAAGVSTMFVLPLLFCRLLLTPNLRLITQIVPDRCDIELDCKSSTTVA
jgi:hypothetical protein